MYPEFRIKKTISGYQVFYVYKKTFWYKKEILKPFIFYYDTKKIYTFKSIDSAIKSIKDEVIINTELI